MKGLRFCRKNARITQADLARMIGVSQSTVAGWENGSMYPSADKLPAIAEALKCSVDDLFRAA